MMTVYARGVAQEQCDTKTHKNITNDERINLE